MKETIERLREKQRYTYGDLLGVMRILRSPEGCPWDREQDHASIRSALIEETYEVIEAIDNGDPSLLREELGDLLFQIVFHACLEEEVGRFDMGDVIHDIAAKMVHRHPHVFGTVKVENSDEVLSNWEVIKTEEKQRNTLYQKLCAVPPMLPALMRAAKVSKKAGVDTDTAPKVLIDRLEGELNKLRGAAESGDGRDAQAAMGSFLMQAAILARRLGVDGEEALGKETDRLIASFAPENA